MITLFKKEVWRYASMPFQTIAPPVITTLLYFIIFGVSIGPRIGQIQGVNYLEFIMPGLIMMNTLIYTYSNVAYSLQITKISRSMSDVLATPLSYTDIILGYVLASVIRGIITGLLIFLTAMLFIPISVLHPMYLISFFVVVTFLFSLLGLIIGLWAESFEQVSLFPTFFLTPLSFLGGIFYSIDMLPAGWQAISRFNPILYIINGLRYGFYGISDVNATTSYFFLVFVTVLLYIACYVILKSGYRIRS